MNTFIKSNFYINDIFFINRNEIKEGNGRTILHVGYFLFIFVKTFFFFSLIANKKSFLSYISLLQLEEN